MNNDDGLSKPGSIVPMVASRLTGPAVSLLLALQSGRGSGSLINHRIRDSFERGRKARERIASETTASLAT